MERFKKINRGQSMVEILVAMGIAAAVLPAILTGFIAGREGKVTQDLRLRATAYLRESQEATRVFREKDWIGFAETNGIYHPVISSGTWSLSSGSETISDFTRSIAISDVTPPDPSMKLVTYTVSWGGGSTQKVFSKEYFSRYVGNSIQSGGGTIQSAGGFGNWCVPTGPSVTNVDLVRTGHPTVVRALVASDGSGNRVFGGTGANSSGSAFTNVNVTGNTPPLATILGEYNGTPQVKVNGLWGDANFAFLATDNRGVEILNLNTTPYQKIGSFNPGGMKKAADVYVVGNTGYVVTEDKFYIFSISSDRTSTTQVGILSLANGKRVVVDSGNQYAYIANPDPNGELKIIDIHSNPTSLSSSDITNVNIDGGVGRDVYVNAVGNRAYLATAANSSKPEFFIIDITNKLNPSVILSGTYDTNGMDPNGISIVPGEKAIIVGVNGNEYQVFSIENDQVALCPNHDQNNDFINIDEGVFTVTSVLQSDGHAYSYIATGDSSAEIKIIEGGTGGGGGGTGTFESNTFDAGHNVAFNYFTATSDPSLTYKISIKQGLGGNCSGVTFADGDFVTFPPGPLPLSTIGTGFVNPGQCMRYRVINSGGSEVTYSISFNYSP